VTVRVLYVAGFGRSGSTLLGNVLGSVEGWFSTGELHLLWTALLRGSGCGCGERIDRCPVWSSVLERLAEHAVTDPATVRGWQLAEARLVHTPRLLRIGTRADSGRPVLDRYVRLLGDLYRAIAEVTGSTVIVDSSKTAADAAVLARVPAVEASILQLVRDPRAVAFSHAKVRPTLDPHRTEEMHRRGTVESAARWVGANALVRRVRRRAPGSTAVVRYEDLVADPRRALPPLLALAGDPHAQIPFVGDRIVRMGPNHTAWGNRSRFSIGDVEIVPDDRWRAEISTMTVATTTALTLPWLARYGYGVSVRRSQDRSGS
jgi:hypothetical protein